MKRISSLISIMALSAALASAAKAEIIDNTPVPVIGAQVFIEPGQTADDIEEYFSIMEDCNLKVARIRMFGVHLCKNGIWDYTLYDQAFDAAQRHGIRLFATLFPQTDELTDLGGFKFPRSKAHLAEIDDYVKHVVEHYRNHPALSTWVLQNEPGTERTFVEKNDLTEEIRANWNPATSEYDNGYLKQDFSESDFLRFYTVWYLKHLSDLVKSIDPVHGQHVNPHQIMRTIPEYDFPELEKFLTSLGASFHLSWHFDLYTPQEYPLGVSLMSDIIRNAAGSNPFWVTELQGGNTTASGFVPYCPSGNHIAQYLWTSIAAGSRGAMFWSLNPRAAAMEAGDWGLLDFQRKPSERLVAAADVAGCIEENKSLFERMKPYMADVTILYNIPSLRIQRHNFEKSNEPYTGRQKDAVMVSVETAYKALSEWGITPDLKDMALFDWSNPEGRTVILPHCISIPSWEWSNIRNFVKDGGKLILTGLSGYYDENMYCILMDRPQPLADVFGATVREFRVMGDYFPLEDGLEGHLWMGTLIDENGEHLQTRKGYGKGEVLWIASPIELGAYHRTDSMDALTAFYGKECRKAIDQAPLHFSQPVPNVLMRTMLSESGETVLVLVNKNARECPVELNRTLSSCQLIFGTATVSGRSIILPADSCTVLKLQ